jgi:hypothetical protein
VSHLHLHSGQEPGSAEASHARSSDLRTADLPVVGASGIISSAAGMRPFAGSGLGPAPNKRVNLIRSRSGSDTLSQTTHRLRAVRWTDQGEVDA